ncbi:MAG: TPM domain-containing protein, partial [Phycisphaerales bacterium]|nr:TPM domain-containing protein [Phycisphaerales bacterium]
MIDLRDVIDSQTEQTLDQALYDLREQTRVQIVVATIASTEGVDVMRFATDQGHRWGLGDKDTDLGALVVIAVDDRKYAIATGYGAEGILTDQYCGQIGRDYFRPRFREGDYSGGILGGVMAMIDRVAQERGVQVAVSTPRPRPRVQQQGPKQVVMGLFALMVFAAIVLSVIARVAGYSGRRSWRGGYRGGGLLWWLLADAMLSGRRRGGGWNNDSWGGGGWGGG